MFALLELKVENQIAWLTINRPEALNALNSNIILELDKAIDFVKSKLNIRVLIITGKGKAFVAGADIKEMENFTPEEAANYAESAHKVFNKLENLNIPVIAAVNGYALGGGCELALSCDIRIGNKFAKFGQPEVGLGITPGFGGTQRLPRLVGTGIAKELIYTGKIIDSNKAQQIGLLNDVVEADQLSETIIKLAENIIKNSKLAIAKSKQAINNGLNTDLNTALSIEQNIFSLCFSTSDQKEGMQAFTEKRKPRFENK